MRKAPVYEKAYKRTVRDTISERDLGYGRLKDYGHGRNVEIFWDISEEAKKDQIFRLKVGNTEVFLDADEFNKYLRWI